MLCSSAAILVAISEVYMYLLTLVATIRSLRHLTRQHRGIFCSSGPSGQRDAEALALRSLTLPKHHWNGSAQRHRDRKGSATFGQNFVQNRAELGGQLRNLID